MTYEFIYWFFLLVWLLFGGYRGYVGFATPEGRVYLGGSLLTFFLFLIIGLKLFGWPIKG